MRNDWGKKWGSSSKFSLDFFQDSLTKRFHYFLKEVLLVQEKDLQSIWFPAILFLSITSFLMGAILIFFIREE